MSDTKSVPVAVTIATRQGPHAVKGLPSETPGLVLTRTAFTDTVRQKLGFWAVTHAASGHAFALSLPNREIAALVAAWLGRTGVDWTQDIDAICADEAARDASARFTPHADRLLETVVELLTEMDFTIESPKRRRCSEARR